MTGSTSTENARVGLELIARRDGTLAIVAMDQRNTLRRMLKEIGRPETEPEMCSFKVDVTASLSPLASAVLLDPDYGVPAVRASGAMAEGCATLIASEPSERESWKGEPRVSYDAKRNASWVRSLGGDALKLLVYLRPDRPTRPGEPDLLGEAVEAVRAVVEDCASEKMASVVETLLYQLPGEQPLDAGRRAALIIESARILTETRPDLLKLEYPGDAASCRALSDVLTVPWAVLSSGMAFPAFLEALATACDEGGASGFIAGRVYWKEAVALEHGDRLSFLQTTARDRLEQSIELMEGRARPWAARRYDGPRG